MFLAHADAHNDTAIGVTATNGVLDAILRWLVGLGHVDGAGGKAQIALLLERATVHDHDARHELTFGVGWELGLVVECL